MIPGPVPEFLPVFMPGSHREKRRGGPGEGRRKGGRKIAGGSLTLKNIAVNCLQSDSQASTFEEGPGKCSAANID